MKRTVFLSDAHLHAPEDANYRLLLDFLATLPGTVETLCILGDLFDFRVGLPALRFPEQEPLLDALRHLVHSGIRLIYLEGNHDFHLHPDLSEGLGAEVYAGPVVLELQGKRVYLCHGDLINRADWRYRLLHTVLRHPLTLGMGRLLPVSLVTRMRTRLQRTSKKRYRHNRSRWDYPAMIRGFGATVRAQGYDALVLGHFHRPFMDHQGDFILVSLGDWISQFSYAELCDGDFRLLTYPA